MARTRRTVRFESVVDAGILALAAAAAFWPVLRNGFVNWDDPAVFIDNGHLVSGGVVRWAFSTTLIGHYQPIAWLVWAAVAWLSGVSPIALHALSLTVHASNGILVYTVARRLAADMPLTEMQRRFAGLTAGAIFLLHPAAVETVAWASAFPYALSLLALLSSFLAYVDERRAASIALYAISLLARPAAFGFPLLLLIADAYPLHRTRRTPLVRLLLEKIPFAVVAIASAAVEWRARDVASLHEIGVVPRITMALAAPFVYLRRTL